MVSVAIIPAPAWLALATAGWYLASRTLCAPTARRTDRVTIFSLCLPLATTCLAAIVLRHPDIAIGVTLAGSVAAVTLVLGLVGISQPLHALVTPPKAWMFLLPTAVIALLIGFSGEIRPIHAAILVLQGLAVLIGSKSFPVERDRSRIPLPTAVWIVRVFACLAMLTASLLAVYAADSISRDLQQPGNGLIAAVMLSPALVLPMIGVTTALAGEREPIKAISLIVHVVLINLCVLLPLSAAAWIAVPSGLSTLGRSVGLMPATLPTSQPTTYPSDVAAEIVHFAYPISVWRIDTVLLLMAGMFLLLLSLGRVQLGRIEATALILIYVAYLMLTAVAAR